MSTPSDAYSYSPKELLASYERLKMKEEELLERASGDAAMDATNFSEDSPESATTPGGSDTGSSAVKKMVVAATQITGAGLPHSDVTGFCFRAEQAVEVAARRGANLILLPELWCAPYFCQSQVADLLMLADPANETNVLIKRMQQLAKLYGVVLPISLYERKNNALYNSVVMIDSDGSVLGTYRKTHIPDGTGYQEKFYFTPGDTGFKVFDTRVGKVGVAICWDQWFPESARCLALQGADVILYPTAIGSEPQDPTLNSADHWQRVMQGHSAANMVPVVASNRFGTEILTREDGMEVQRIHFYGRSFITDNKGAKIAECRNNSDTNDPVVVVTAEIDVEKNLRERLAWGMFRDRRPDLYGTILGKDGAAR
jgi:N-carbamoylputrescine amidase